MSSNGYIQYIRNSERAKSLRKRHPNAFLLLSLIAERARRTDNVDDGREVGEAEIGDFKEAGLKTRKIYRKALEILEKEAFIVIVATQKKLNQWTGTGSALVQNGATEGATKRATNGTLVKLIDNSVWDINPDKEIKEKSTKRATEGATVGATEGPPKGHKQERKKEKEGLESLSKDNSSNPPPKPPKRGKGERGGKEAFKYQGKISNEAFNLHQLSVDQNCACSADRFQFWLDELEGDFELLKRELLNVAKLTGVVSPPGMMGFRVSNLKKSFKPEIKNREEENRETIKNFIEKSDEQTKKFLKIWKEFVDVKLGKNKQSIFYSSPTFAYEWAEAKKNLTKGS